LYFDVASLMGNGSDIEEWKNLAGWQQLDVFYRAS
jgi:hypothetical protein